jgi:hypothetical protein
LFDLVPPQFNRLTLFDDRIPHAVQRLDGSMDPVEGRFVLHGHISEGGIVAQGPVTAEAIRERIADIVDHLRSSSAGAQGPLVVSIDIGPDGKVQQARPILDRLAHAGREDLDALRATVLERISAVQFPSAASSTRANIPLIF